MKIALFSETYLPYINGVVTHVKSLKDGLEQMGHQVLVVTASAKINHHYIDQKHGVLWCPAKEIKRMYNYGIALPISRQRCRLIEQFDPDIIHIHTEFSIGLSGLKIAKTLKIPVVYTMHTMYDNYLYYIAPKPFIPIFKKVSRRYFRYFVKHAEAITGPSAKVQNYLNQCGIMKPVDVIPNPVELDKFQLECINQKKVAWIKEKYIIRPEELIICFCGRLGREKSIDVLLSYFSKTYNPQNNIRLMILGDGPCKKDLINLAEQLGITEAIIFTGQVNHDELINYYACCQLYITASLSDTNSISMLEAMATGLPVVCRYDLMNEGQVNPGINGFIFVDEQEMHQILLNYQQYPAEKKLAMKYAVIESVKKSGQETLAKYLIDVYQHLGQPKHTTKQKTSMKK